MQIYTSDTTGTGAGTPTPGHVRDGSWADRLVNSSTTRYIIQLIFEFPTSLLLAAGSGNSLLYCRYILLTRPAPVLSKLSPAASLHHCEAREQRPGMVGVTHSSLGDHVASLALRDEKNTGLLASCSILDSPPTSDRSASQPTDPPALRPSNRPTDRPICPAERPTKRPTGRFAIRFPSGRVSRLY